MRWIHTSHVWRSFAEYDIFHAFWSFAEYVSNQKYFLGYDSTSYRFVWFKHTTHYLTTSGQWAQFTTWVSSTCCHQIRPIFAYTKFHSWQILVEQSCHLVQSLVLLNPTTSRPTTSGIFLLSLNQLGNLSTIPPLVQPLLASIQVRSASTGTKEHDKRRG